MFYKTSAKLGLIANIFYIRLVVFINIFNILIILGDFMILDEFDNELTSIINPDVSQDKKIKNLINSIKK